MNEHYVRGYCAGQNSKLTVSGESGSLEATVELPDGLEWDFGHSGIALTQREGQSDSEFWEELMLGMRYKVVLSEG
jgi:hypothetical protein